METGVNTKKIGSTLDIKSWTNKELGYSALGDWFGFNTTHFSLAINKDNLYIIGGKSRDESEYLPTVDVKKVRLIDGGKLGEPVITDTPLPKPLFYADTIDTSTHIYLLGGDTGSETSDDIYMNNKKEDGNLSDWYKAGKLPYPVSDFKAIQIDKFIYIIGGFNGSDSINKVTRCTIGDGSDEDYKLCNFEDCKPLPIPMSDCKVLVLANKLYVLGGYQGSDFTALDTVYSAIINNDFSLGEWVIDKPLPEKLFGSSLVAYANRIFLLGGNNGNKAIYETYIAPVDNEGIIGEWVKGSSLSEPCSNIAAIITSLNVYLIGGSVNYTFSPFDGFSLTEL